MTSNNLDSFIRSVRMPFDGMSKAGRIVIAVLFFMAGICTLYVGLTASYPIITVGAIVLCLISVVLGLPDRRR